MGRWGGMLGGAGAQRPLVRTTRVWDALEGRNFQATNSCALGAWISLSLDSSRAGSFYCCFLSR